VNSALFRQSLAPNCGLHLFSRIASTGDVLERPRCQKDTFMNYNTMALSGLSMPFSEFDFRFDKITSLASRLLGVPVSLLTVIDDAGGRQLLKSAVGVPDELQQSRATPLSHSFCKHVRDSRSTLLLTDAREHPLHMHNPAIEDYGVVSYLGVPFHGERGKPIGALCCSDQRPREWSEQDVELLIRLASIADDQFYLASAVRDRARAKLFAEKAARTRASFLSHANHEVRTPLSAISGAARLLSAISADDKARNLVEVIERNTSRLLALTEDLVRITELDTATASIAAESFDLINVIEDVVARNLKAARSKGIALTFNNQANANTIFLFDVAILTNVMEQLVSNAIKFTADGEVQVTVEATSQEDFVILRVSDTGLGIGPNLQSRLFDEFEGHDPQTAREGGGTGLGMNIIKREVDLLGGTLSLSSELGEGTHFTICLPTARSLVTDEQIEEDEQSDPRHITCLECGEELNVLRRHISQKHDMTPEAYRSKWGLPDDFELSSPAYRAMRRAVRNQK
jgi:signal transduction histidine kinase